MNIYERNKMYLTVLHTHLHGAQQAHRPPHIKPRNAYQVRPPHSMRPWMVRPHIGWLATPSRLIRTEPPILNCPPRLSRREPSPDRDTSGRASGPIGRPRGADPLGESRSRARPLG